MNNNEKKKKYLLYGIVGVLLLLSTLIFKAALNVSADDNNVAIKTAKITSIQTGTAFTGPDGIVEDDDGNMTSHTAGLDSSADNRLVRSNDQITYNFDFSIGGINNDNGYYSRVVDLTVTLSPEEAKYVSFEANKAAGETTKQYSFDNISSRGGEYSKSITLYVVNCPDGKEIAPKFSFVVKDSTSNTPVVLGKNETGNLDYAYSDGRYTNTNRSTVTNFLPTIVSATQTPIDFDLVSAADGQKAIYDNQLGRFFTAVVSVYVPNAKGSYVSDENLSLSISTSKTGGGDITINDNWVRLYNSNLVDTIEAVRVNAPYSVDGGSTANNQTRQPGAISYSSGTASITGFKIPVNGPGVSAADTTLDANKKVVGTYAISLFSPRVTADGKNDVNVTLNVNGKSVTFTNQYYSDTDYNLQSGFYDEAGSQRITKHVNTSGAIEDLPSSTSKGSTISYKTTFKYKKTGSNSGFKQVLKVDPIAFRVIPFSSKKDVEVKVNCGNGECDNISQDDFEFKYLSGDFVPANYTVTEPDSRVSDENKAYTESACSTIGANLGGYSRDQLMNLYGGPCIKDTAATVYDNIVDARNTQKDESDNIISDDEDPITKVIIQTKEGVNLPDTATVTIIVKLRVRNVADITRSYQAGVVLSTSDTDSELYYFAPTIDGNATSNILNPDNYTRSTFTGTTVNLNSPQQYADSIRIVNFTARQDLTVTNTESDGTTRISYAVDDNETIQYKLSTSIQDFNEQVGADDVWYLKAVRMTVTIPKELDYIPDDSLGTPEVYKANDNSPTILTYTIPWTKANFKIPDVYFNTKLSYKLTGNRVPITVTASFNPININDEYDASVVAAKETSFVIYGTQSTTVLLSQTNEGRTIVDKNESFSYLLHAFNNTGSQVNDFIIEDILPYDGDDRGSKFSGSYEVKVTLPSSQPRTKVYCTNKDPKTIKGQVNSTEDQYEECEAADEFVSAKAIRITGIDLADGQTMEPIKVTIKPKNNKFSDKYVNNFNGGFDQQVSKTSNKIKFSVINRTISGRVFMDADQDGVRSESEKLIPGMTATLFKVEDGKLKEVSKPVTTDKDGEYKFENLEAGFYRVRIDYSNDTYDLALRYGSENTATDSDAYKISDGKAEISGKYAPGTVDGIDLTVFEKYKATDMDMGLIPRQTFGFTMKKYITQVDLNYNNTLDTKKYNNESTVAVTVRDTLRATAKVYYGMAITNSSSKAGYIKLVHEDLPQGLEFDPNDPYNAQWKMVGNEIQSTVYENDVVEPGETKYLQIALFMPSRETGNTFINNVNVDVEEYIPKELAKEAEFEGDSYEIGDAVNFAGVGWNVLDIEEGADSSEQILTLLAQSGTIPGSGMANMTGSVYRWGNSPIRTYINNYEADGWLAQNSINHSILYDQVVCNDASSFQGASYGGSLASAGTCTSNEYITNKVRLINQADYDKVKARQLSDYGWLYGTKSYWAMDSVDSTIYHTIYGQQSNAQQVPNTDVNYYAKYIDFNSASVKADKSATNKLEVRPVITISSKNIIGN